MVSKKFYLVGEGESATIDIDVSSAPDWESLKILVAGQFAITAADSMRALNVLRYLADIFSHRIPAGIVSTGIDGRYREYDRLSHWHHY